LEKIDGKSLDLTKTNVETLKQLFPEVVTEGKIDFDKLKFVLGEQIEMHKEKYEFTWHGKLQSLKMAQTPSTGTLRPDKESSKNWDTTENLYIEGDNLEVLKLLQKSYFGQIKMIYIDPPYNTGNDFIYKDNFRNNIENYKEVTQQVTKANFEKNGRFHTDWLNMIYPRLKLAKNLLRDDGIIFISIDDNELANLQKVCDEIFGEENFVACFIWEKRTNRENRKVVSTRHDYVICYSRNSNQKEKIINLLPMNEEALSRYKNPDDDPRGLWKSDPAHAQAGHGTKSQFYVLRAPNGKEHHLPSGRCWLYTKEVMEEAIRDGRIWFGKDGNGVPRIKTYLNAKERGLTPESILFANECSTTEKAKTKLKELFDNYAVFDTPKPVELLKLIISISANEGIILDFFSGSAPTAHAIMQLNAQDNANRKFIMVQLPEVIEKGTDAYNAGYHSICEIGKERIHRAGEKILKDEERKDLDIGYKVFKLDSSNIKHWDPDLENLEQGMLEQLENIKEDRTKEDLLFEILLKVGIPLTTSVEEVKINGKIIYNVAFGSVLLCLEDKIDLDIVNEMIKLKLEDFETKVIFKESGFLNDSVKTNAIQTLKKNGINDVRSV
jgi:adenine-specific DNA-methyltransferase